MTCCVARIVMSDSVDWDFFPGRRYIIDQFCIFFIITVLNMFVSIKSDTFITPHRTLFSTDTSSFSCTLHINLLAPESFLK